MAPCEMYMVAIKYNPNAWYCLRKRISEPHKFERITDDESSHLQLSSSSTKSQRSQNEHIINKLN